MEKLQPFFKNFFLTNPHTTKNICQIFFSQNIVYGIAKWFNTVTPSLYKVIKPNTG